MAPSPASDDGKNADMDTGKTLIVAQPDPTPREGQLLQGIASLQMQLNVVSQRQDELMGLVGVLRDQQEGPIPGPSSDIRGRTFSPRGSMSYVVPGVAPPAEGGRVQSISNSSRLPSPAPPNHPRLPPPHSNPVTFARPDTLPLHQNLESGRPIPGLPDPQQIPPSQGHGQDLRQPPFYHSNQNGQPLGPPPPPQSPVNSLGYSVPVFGQLQDPTGQVIGLVHRGSFTVAGYTDAGRTVRQPSPGHPHMSPQVYPQTQPQVHPQAPPQMNPQIPPLVHPQMPPQTQTQGQMLMNWSTPPGPPPPYLGPGLAPGEPIPGINQSGPSTTRRGASRTSGSFVALQPRSSRLYPNQDQEGDGIGLDVQPASRREATGRAPTRANPARKARPTQLRESD